MRNRAEVEKWLRTAEAKSDLSGEEKDQVFKLLGDPAMLLLWGLMLGARQGQFVQLGNTGLHDEVHRYSAAVIQGQIKGIELLHQTLVELLPAEKDDAEGAKA